MNTKARKEDLLTDEDMRPENIRVRISIMIPEDVLLRFKELAAKQRIPYQTLMNQALLEYAQRGSMEERLGEVEKIIQKMRA